MFRLEYKVVATILMLTIATSRTMRHQEVDFVAAGDDVTVFSGSAQALVWSRAIRDLVAD